MQSTPFETPIDTTIIRTGSDGRLRYTPAQRGELLDAFERSGMSAMAFSRQHGISYQTFIAWLRKRRQSCEALPPGDPSQQADVCFYVIVFRSEPLSTQAGCAVQFAARSPGSAALAVDPTCCATLLLPRSITVVPA